MTTTMTPDVAVTRRGMGITIAVTAAIVGVVYGYDTGSIAGIGLILVSFVFIAWMAPETPRDADAPPRAARRRSESVPAR